MKNIWCAICYNLFDVLELHIPENKNPEAYQLLRDLKFHIEHVHEQLVDAQAGYTIYAPEATPPERTPNILPGYDHPD